MPPFMPVPPISMPMAVGDGFSARSDIRVEIFL
jgi:hypothetical protein